MDRLIGNGFSFLLFLAFPILSIGQCQEQEKKSIEWQPIALRSTIAKVQPMTGLVLWTTNEKVAEAPIQLEYSYMTYAQVVQPDGSYQWDELDRLLEQVASRKHQLILRWHDTYVGKKTGIPLSVTSLSGYQTTAGKSEGKNTEFPDWSHPGLQQFAFDFFEKFAQRYDRDSRIAFLQVGFGLWAEYHIYDGPMILGKTFPSKDYQQTFAKHLHKHLKQTPWMISVDAADSDRTPFEDNAELLALRFGLFDDSFNHKKHAKENEPNWKVFGSDRWKSSPMGGEFSFFEPADQKKALDPNGPHGISFEQQAAKFHVSFMIADAQPRHQKPERLTAASQACGYQFKILTLETSGTETRLLFENKGIAPIYFDAYPSVHGLRSKTSLRGLLPGETRQFTVAKPIQGKEVGRNQIKIECDRLVPGQEIEYEASLQ
jgi:hypothetical protein